MKYRRIGLLGGTFNPIHNGHLHIASEVLKRLHLDQVFFIPARLPPHKGLKGILSPTHRMKMVELALADIPQFLPCDIEIKRSGPSYTIDTVQSLQKQYPGDRLYFILGMDAFSEIKTWKSPKKLLSLCNFIIISRPGYSFSSLPVFEPFYSVDREALHQLDCSKQEQYAAEVSHETTLHFLNIPPARISASAIRKDLLAGKPAKKRLPHSVESYIIYHNLYREDDHS